MLSRRTSKPVPPTTMMIGQSTNPVAPTATRVSAAVVVDRDPLLSPCAAPRAAPWTPPATPLMTAPPTAPAVSVTAVTAVWTTANGNVTNLIGTHFCLARNSGRTRGCVWSSRYSANTGQSHSSATYNPALGGDLDPRSAPPRSAPSEQSVRDSPPPSQLIPSRSATCCMADNRWPRPSTTTMP